VAEVLESRRGVCQDFAHVQIACLRALGLAGRYVSGYLRTHPPLGKPRLVGADASHAWVSAWCPGFGWIDVDPTNDLVVAQEHVVLAWGRDFADVSPVRGVILGGGSHSLDVAVQMDELP
jgi:transglutaminase-like putative cysteine protease